MAKISKTGIFHNKVFRVNLLVSNFMQNMKKSNETILSNIQKVDFSQLLRPILAHFLGKRAFFQKSDNNILNDLCNSIFMQENIKTVERLNCLGIHTMNI